MSDTCGYALPRRLTAAAVCDFAAWLARHLDATAVHVDATPTGSYVAALVNGVRIAANLGAGGEGIRVVIDDTAVHVLRPGHPTVTTPRPS